MSGVVGAPATYQEATKLDRARAATGDTAHTPLRIMLAGNANMEFLTPALRVHLAREGFDAVVGVASYANWVGDVLATDGGGSEGSHSDVWLIWMSGMGATRGLTERPQIDTGSIVMAVQRLLERGSKVVFIHPDPLPVEDDPFSPFADWRRDLIRALRAALPAATVQVDVEHLVRRIGMASWTATRYWEQAKAPCHPDAATAVGVEAAVVIARLFRPAVRAVAVDLDDTIWGGIVGEVGPQGLDLDPDGTGRPYLEMQRLLLDLSDRGIAIGVVSKNDDNEARRPFLERPEMLLSVDSFVRFDASWNPKCEGIARFAEQLNVGIDSVCFLDDSPYERDEARRLLPGLIVPELSESPARRVEQLLQSRLFTMPLISEEDRLRVEFFKREELPEPADLNEYLGSLQMKLHAEPINKLNGDRALALLHKTNQFNVTLWRPVPTEFEIFVNDEHNYAHVFRLRDRVGDAGNIAVLLVSINGECAEIRGWVMSCRVFGRGVEWAAAEHLSRWLLEREVRQIRAPFVHGPRNAMVEKVLSRLGFVASATDDGVTIFSAPHLELPDHQITLEAS